jgi:hypothetical protein
MPQVLLYSEQQPMVENTSPDQAESSPPDVKALTPAAQRALAEAEHRRKETLLTQSLPTEINGRDGPEPVRYGDWEVKGLASDF